MSDQRRDIQIRFTNAEQSVELEMRKEVVAARHEHPLKKIARHHSIPVMDHEVTRFLTHIPEGGRIVDVGGCWGWHWRKLDVVRPDVQVVIVDFIRENLLYVRDILGGTINQSIFLVHGDATDLRFPDATLDIGRCKRFNTFRVLTKLYPKPFAC